MAIGDNQLIVCHSSAVMLWNLVFNYSKRKAGVQCFDGEDMVVLGRFVHAH